MTYQEKSVVEIRIEKFEPFSKNTILPTYETNIKLQGKLPSIEAASAFYPFAASLVQTIYSEDSYSKELLQMVSTSKAFSDIIDGKTDVIIATEPSDEQKEWIRNSGISLEFKELYLEPLVIFLHKENSMENLTIDQIKEIYYNNTYNLNTYQLEKNNGSQTCFESIVKNNTLRKHHYELHTMPEIIDKVALDKNGIGYAFYSYYSKMHINTNTKIIHVNNKDITDIDYPLLFKVYLIYRTDNTNENISRIVKWLETEDGKLLIDTIK